MLKPHKGFKWNIFLSKFKINFYWFSNTDSEEIEKNNKT